ncbi:MAG TPA: hypothetical protein VIM62_06625, partial [Acidobacteriaceae bacterium]
MLEQRKITASSARTTLTRTLRFAAIFAVAVSLGVAILLAPLPRTLAAGQQSVTPSPQQPTPPAQSPDDGVFGDNNAATHGVPAPWLSVEPTEYDKHVAGKYNYAFGKETPFLPSNATSYNGQFLSPKSFLTAQYCGHCHQESYHQWRQSAHSNSFRAPWYLKNVNTLIDEKGVQFSRHCEGCH